MRRTVVRDAQGRVINIGPWDYAYEPAPIIAVGGEPVDVPDTPDADAPGGFIPAHTRPAEPGEVLGFSDTDMVATNPLPEGATIAEEDIVERDDGGFACAGDYASLRSAAYPSLRDQLDALWKGGDAADAMRARVLAVKERFPKDAQPLSGGLPPKPPKNP